MTNNTTTKRYLFVGSTILLLGLFFFGFFPRFFQTQKINRAAERNDPPEVRLLLAKPEDQPLQFILPSVTQSNHVTPIWARTNGYLVKLLVDIGDAVQEGQILAVLDTPEVDQQYEQAVFDLANAIAKRDLAKLLAERGQKIFELDSQAISQEDLDQRKANYIAAKADVSSSEANMNRYKDLMEFKNIVAPFDGIIIERDVDLGSLISAGSNGTPQQLFVISTSDIIRVFASIPQYAFRSIQEGMEAIVKIREFLGISFKSIVKRYAKALDQTSHTMLTELHIDNKNGDLLPGLYCEISFVLKPETPYFIVPITAVIIREGDPKIAVIDDKAIVHLKKVKIGLDFGKTVEIVEGIETGDKIITNPTEKIREGVEVNVSGLV